MFIRLDRLRCRRADSRSFDRKKYKKKYNHEKRKQKNKIVSRRGNRQQRKHLKTDKVLKIHKIQFKKRHIYLQMRKQEINIKKENEVIS